MRGLVAPLPPFVGVDGRTGCRRHAGDEVILPLLREHFTPLINERVIDVLRLDIRERGARYDA